MKILYDRMEYFIILNLCSNLLFTILNFCSWSEFGKKNCLESQSADFASKCLCVSVSKDFPNYSLGKIRLQLLSVSNQSRSIIEGTIAFSTQFQTLFGIFFAMQFYLKMFQNQYKAQKMASHLAWASQIYLTSFWSK